MVREGKEGEWEEVWARNTTISAGKKLERERYADPVWATN